MDWIATAFGFIGTVVLIKTKHWVALAIYCVSDLLWVFYLFPRGEYRAVALFVMYLATQGYGIYEWMRKKC
jgi:nicotinamide riboside transporter PnuC